MVNLNIFALCNFTAEVCKGTPTIGLFGTSLSNQVVHIGICNTETDS